MLVGSLWMVAWTNRVENLGILHYGLNVWMGIVLKPYKVLRYRIITIHVQNNNKLDWPGYWPVVWYTHYLWHEFEWVGSFGKTDTEHEKYCVEKGFQWARTKLDKNGMEVNV